MRSLSSWFRTEAQAQQTGDVYVTLLEITYTGASSTLYLVNNYQDIESNGNTYTAFPFVFTPPEEGDTPRSIARISFDNVDRSMAEFVGEVPVNTDIKVKEILLNAEHSDPLTTAGHEITRDYVWKNISIDRKVVSGDLEYLAYLNYAFPKMRKTPSKFPGVF
jgi:hypothetical protein